MFLVKICHNATLGKVPVSVLVGENCVFLAVLEKVLKNIKVLQI